MSLFSRPNARRGSSRRPARRGRRFGPRLEPLEARQLLSPYYVAALNDGMVGDGGLGNPWRKIEFLNNAIAAGSIHGGDTIHFRRGDTFPGNLVFDSVGGSPGNPITIRDYQDVPSEFDPVINAGAGTGISVRNAGGFVMFDLKIVGNYVPSQPTLNSGNGIEFVSGPHDVLLQPYEYFRLSRLDISGFGGAGPVDYSCTDTEDPTDEIASGDGIYFYAEQPLDWNTAYTHFKDIEIWDSDLHDNEFAGLLTHDSLDLCEFDHNQAIEKFYVHHVDAYRQKPRDADNPEVVQGGNGIALGSVRDGVIERNRTFENGRSDYPVLNVGLGSHNSRRLLVQFNESRHNTSKELDGNGIHLDRWTTETIAQNNYTHNNAGAGMVIGGRGATLPMEL